jgi:hypothetical protein
MLKNIFITSVIATSLASAFAMTPTLQLINAGSGDNVQVTVSGDPNTSVTLYYTLLSNGATQSTAIGTTDSNGYLSTVLSTASLGLNSTIPVAVIMNGYQSSSMTWPYLSSSTPFSVNQSSVSIITGASVSVSATGLGTYYVSNNSNPSVVVSSVNGSTITLYGISSGTAIVTICQDASNCTNINVTVGGTTQTITSSPVVISPVIALGQSMNFILSGNTAPYSISTNSGNYFTSSLSGTTLTVTGNSLGTGSVNICSATNACTLFTVTVTTPTTPSGITTPTATATQAKYMFYKPITYGYVGDEVLELQKRLALEGYFNGSYSTHYGNVTIAAVKAYQKDHGLAQLGNLGPATRALLNGN